ncbi:hypothetical protein ACK3TF_004177 [Chlorella vulgaris]
MLQLPMWSAVDVLPATLGIPGFPGMVLPPPPPMPEPLAQHEQQGQQGAGQRAPRRKRARIMREGQLTMITYGANEALLWTRRVAAFQHTMRGVLGDRRLTFKWGGSVLDSVVGVFLTQNVSDHLSSRAYMELASRFPPPRRRRLMEAGGGPAPKDASAALPGDGNWASCEDSVDWEAVRLSSREALSDAIKCRGMQHRLAQQIIDFLNQIRQHNMHRLRKEQRAAAKEAAATAAAAAAAAAAEAEAGAASRVAAAPGDDEPSIAEPSGSGAGAGGAAAGAMEAIPGSAASAPAAGPGSGGSPRRRHIALCYEEESEAQAQQQQQQSGTGQAAAGGEVALAPGLSAKEQAAAAAPPAPAGGGDSCGGGGEASGEPAAHELLSLEWLREAPDEAARSYLMNINGLGRKSVGCIMLLTLGKKEFPVDTNVGRICARLGWIPLDAEQAVEDLDDYAPEPEVHAYLHSRLLGFDVETLYELHYQMITLGKVFCNKQAPNCKACPLHDSCEYSINNGPSLHGRKRVRQPAPELGDGFAPPMLADDDRRRFFAGGGAIWDGDGGADSSATYTTSVSGGSDSGADSEESGEEDEEGEGEEDAERRGPPPLTRRQARSLAGGGAVQRRRYASEEEEEEDVPPVKPTLRQVFAAAMAEATARRQRVHWRTLERLVRMHEEELREGLVAQILDLEALVAATPRRSRTPGLRLPTTRFERVRRLKRSREFQQLLAESGEQEVEHLLQQLGVAGGAGAAASRQRGGTPAAPGGVVRRSGRTRGGGAAAAAAAPAGKAGATPPSRGKKGGAKASQASMAQSVAAAQPGNGKMEAEQEEEPEHDREGEDEGQEAGPQRDASLSPEADRRLACGERMVLHATRRMPTRRQALAPDGGAAGGAAGLAAACGTRGPPGSVADVGDGALEEEEEEVAATPAVDVLDAGDGEEADDEREQEEEQQQQQERACGHVLQPAEALRQLLPLPIAGAASSSPSEQLLPPAVSLLGAQLRAVAAASHGPAVAVPAAPTLLPAALAGLDSHGAGVQQLLVAVAAGMAAALPAVADAANSTQVAPMIISVATDSGLFGDAAMLETPCAADREEAAAQVEEQGGVPAGVGEAAAAAAEAEEGDAELAAAAATAAAAVHIADAGSECERLAGLGHELAAAQRALLIAEGKGPGTDLTAFKLRLVEVSLLTLGLEAVMDCESANLVLASAKRVYRKLSILVHPDRCALPLAKDAFAAASQAMQFVCERAEALEAGGDAGACSGSGDEQGGAGFGTAAGDGTALIPFQDAEELLQQVVWNTNRLAVQVSLVPPGELLSRGLLHPAYQQQFAAGSSLAAEPLLFLPLAAIPTFKKRSRKSGVAALAAAAARSHAQLAPPTPAAAAPAAAAADSQEVAEEGEVGELEASQAEPAEAALELGAAPAPAGGGSPADVEAGAAAAPAVSAAAEAPLADWDGVLNRAPSGVPIAGLPAEAAGAEAAEAAGAEAGGAAAAGAGAAAAPLEDPLTPGLLLFTARTSLAGRFALNGTYFQVNEVFADHGSSQAPIQLPRSVLDACKPSTVHFGHSIHFMCKGMRRPEVAHMFSHGFVCFRAFQAASGAPVVLPDYLQPSIPTKSNAPWKNKDQRAAAQAAKVAACKGLPPPPPPMPTPEVRWLRLPLDGTELPVLPAVLPDGEQERQACSLEEYGSDLPQDSSLAGLGSPPKRKWASGGSGKQKKQRAWGEGDEEEQEEGVSYSAAPHSQEARDAKSGKGRKRLFLHPIIRTRDRCGKCSACLNLHWKKACITRRAELEGTTQ